MSATVIAQPVPDEGRVEVLIWDRTAPAVLYRNDGTGPVPVRGANPIPAGLPNPVVVYDYEAPANTDLTYSLTDGSGTVTATARLNTTDAWLVHPSLPFLSRRVTVLDQPASDWDGRSTEFEVIGRAFPLILTAPRASREGRVRLVVTPGPERDGLLRLIADGSVLLLRSGCADRLDTDWVHVRRVTESPLGSNAATSTRRTWDLDIRATDPPAGGLYLDPLWTYADVPSHFSTYGALATTAPDYYHLLNAMIEAGGGTATAATNPGVFAP